MEEDDHLIRICIELEKILATTKSVRLTHIVKVLVSRIARDFASNGARRVCSQYPAYKAPPSHLQLPQSPAMNV